MNVIIRDTNDSSHIAIVDRDNVAETIVPWFPDATAEVALVIELLQEELNRHAGTHAEETYLGITIEPAESDSMTTPEIREWLAARGVPADQLDEQVAEMHTDYLGATRTEMDDVYDEMCGPTA